MKRDRNGKFETLKEKPVFFYVETDIVPFGQGSAMRQFTNLRAYLDLGFDVRIIQFSNICDRRNTGVDGSVVKEGRVVVDYTPAKATVLQRMSLYTGFPRNCLLDLLYQVRPSAVRQVRMHEQVIPGAIHHFEHDALASSAASFHRLNSVWSCHDIFSGRSAFLREMRKEFADVPMNNRYIRARAKRSRTAEDWLARSNKLVLNIARHEHDEFRHQRQYSNVELFPMSWPDEAIVCRNRDWIGNGKLRLLHLGSVDGFVGYDSLRFILKEVFPLIPAATLDKIEFLVVGKLGASKHSKHIDELARQYPQVTFLGFIKNLRQVYGEVDLQVVGSLRASGLRTRIIESFVYGLPVLSTVEAAKGVVGLERGSNILLATDAATFAHEITVSLGNPGRFPTIAEKARENYLENYSRKAAARKLSLCLERYLC